MQDIAEHGRIAADLASAGTEAVENDIALRLALERALYIVGEAAAHLTAATRRAIDQPWPDIIAFRNVLAHRYQMIQPRRLVLVAQRELPGLVEAVERDLARRAGDARVG